MRKMNFTSRFFQLAALALVLTTASLGWLPDTALALPVAMLVVAPFPVQPELTAIAIAYRNARLIADDVLPRVGVGVQTFKYLKHTKEDRFTIPDTKVGRKSAPNEVDFSATEVEASTQDCALDDPIPQADIDNAPVNYDPLGNSAEGLTDLIMLDREKRVADLVFDAAQYATANKATLSGTSQWSDFTNSDPVANLMTGLDACIMRPNVMVIGRAAFTKLAMHPKIAKAVLGNAGDVTIATRAQLAALFELEDVLVGEGWLNTAKKGQAASMARVWGKHCALVYRNRTANTRGGTTFGFTAQFGSRISGAEADSKIGMRGGQRVRVGESVKELITANDLGYFIQNAVA